jgi:hypothetical protein
MTATLLSAVNGLFKRAKVIQGDSGALTSLTDSARQNYVDTAVKAWNDVIREIYSLAREPMPTEYAESTITLATSTREYNLATDLETLRFPLIDQTNGRYIYEYPGGYEAMRAVQIIPANFTGMPLYACINPSNGKIRLDTAPTSSENGKVYNYGYDKRVALTLAADTFPFSDTVVDALELPATELWKRWNKDSFDGGNYNAGMGQAARILAKKELRARW